MKRSATTSYLFIGRPSGAPFFGLATVGKNCPEASAFKWKQWISPRTGIAPTSESIRGGHVRGIENDDFKKPKPRFLRFKRMDRASGFEANFECEWFSRSNCWEGVFNNSDGAVGRFILMVLFNPKNETQIEVDEILGCIRSRL